MLTIFSTEDTLTSQGFFTINYIGSNFVIRERGQLQYEIIEGEDLLENPDNILYDQTIRLTGQ